MTLLPGDIILTGTPSGVGPIASGDRLEVRIQGLAPLVIGVFAWLNAVEIDEQLSATAPPA